MDSLKVASDVEKSTSNIREKYLSLKRHLVENDEYLNRTFSPITKHLKLITDKCSQKSFGPSTVLEDFQPYHSSTPIKPMDQPIFKSVEQSPSELKEPTPSSTSYFGEPTLAQPVLASTSIFGAPTVAHASTSIFGANEPAHASTSIFGSTKVQSSLIPIPSTSVFDTTTKAPSPTFQSPNKSLPNYGLLASEYVDKIINNEMDGFDYIYGVRFNGKCLLMGNAEVKIQNDIINISGNTFLGTPGLYKLMFLKEPGTDIDKSDWKAYQQILSITKAHKKSFSPTGKVNRLLNNRKYTRVISKLFPPRK